MEKEKENESASWQPATGSWQLAIGKPVLPAFSCWPSLGPVASRPPKLPVQSWLYGFYLRPSAKISGKCFAALSGFSDTANRRPDVWLVDDPVFLMTVLVHQLELPAMMTDDIQQNGIQPHGWGVVNQLMDF